MKYPPHGLADPARWSPSDIVINVQVASSASDRRNVPRIAKHSTTMTTHQMKARRWTGKRGLIVKSAEGVRFAYTARPLPKGADTPKGDATPQ